MPGAKNRDATNQRRIRAIAKELAASDLICSGTLTVRTKTCGKPNCRCASDPAARHGPYYEWTWREGGRLAHKTISAEQAELLRGGIRNYQEVKKLLGLWERESAAIILERRSRKP